MLRDCTVLALFFLTDYVKNSLQTHLDHKAPCVFVF